jgi:hypothetical protein
MAAKKAIRRGEHYDDVEISLLYLIERSPEAVAIMADLLGRTPGGVEMAWRWIEKANFPPQAENQIKRQAEAAERRFGRAARGSIKIDRSR